MNYFQYDGNGHPHISVGAVLRNSAGLICAHHFPADTSSGFWYSIGVTDFYILMRETLEIGESLEHAVTRGLKEEFNAVATIDDYLGSYTTANSGRGGVFQKTTLYFLCTYQKDAGIERDLSDAEDQSILEWKSAAELIPIMKAQAAKFGRDDLNESSVLERC